MRAFVLVALLGVAYGNLCSDVSTSDIDSVKATAKAGAAYMLGDLCPSFDFDSVVLTGHCRQLFRQGACYGLKAANKYDGIPTYAELAADVPNFQALGNLACKKIPGCFEQLKGAFEQCVADDADFVSKAVARAEQLYIQDLAGQVAAYADDNAGSLIGELISMGLDQFTSAEDIKNFFDAHITDGVTEDAVFAGTEILKIADNWCKSGCTDKSAKFLKSIFNHMNGGSCSTADEFCGECADRAASWFRKSRNQLPCCVESVIQKGIKAYAYVQKTYGAALTDAAAVIEAGLSPEAVLDAQDIFDEMSAEYNCVVSVYNDNKPENC